MSVPVLLAIAFALAFLCESMTEYIFGKPFNQIPELHPYKWLLMYVSLFVGVLLAFFYQLDMIAAIAEIAGGPIQISWVGFILTGLGIGRGASFLHDFVTAYVINPARK